MTQAISVEQAVQMMVAQKAYFADELQAHVDEMSPDPILPVMLMCDFARRMVAEGKQEFIGVLPFIERLLVEGDEPTRAAIATGFVETLVSAVDRGDAALADINPTLGIKTREYWNAWDKFTRGPNAAALASPAKPGRSWREKFLGR